MLTDCPPLRALLLTTIGRVSREQQRQIDYLVEGNPVRKEQLGGRRLRPTDDQRRGLAANGKFLGRPVLVRLPGAPTTVTDDSARAPGRTGTGML